MLLRPLILLLLVATSLTGCWSRPRVRPNVVIIVIDTLRADRLGSDGNPRGLTPFMDTLAKHGVLFTNAYATSSWTSPSVASLLTSRYPTQHQVVRPDAKLSEDEITLAEKLSAESSLAAGFSANMLINPTMGYAQGFDEFRFVPPTQEEGLKTRATRLQAPALEWLDGLSSDPKKPPFLLFLQYMEPHSPYDPPEPFRARFLREGDDQSKATAVNEKLARFEVGKITPSEDRLLESLYDGEVAAMDSELQAFFAELEKRELLKNAIVVVTSDHGEEFRDHGGLAHGNSLYNETIRVPLIIVGPGVVGGRVVDENVSLVDIAPTLLDLLDLPPEPLFEGRSLAALLKGSAAEAPTDVVSELLPKTVGRSDFRRHEYSLVRSSWKLLVSPRKAPETYNLATDPHEEDAVSLQGGESAKLQAALDRTIDRLAQSKSEQESTQLDAATQEKLRQLGYGH